MTVEILKFAIRHRREVAFERGGTIRFGHPVECSERRVGIRLRGSYNGHVVFYPLEEIDVVKLTEHTDRVLRLAPRAA